MRAAVSFLLVICFSGGVLCVEQLFEDVLREKTIPEAWRMLVSGREEQLKEALLSTPSQDELRPFATELVDAIFPNEETECEGCKGNRQPLDFKAVSFSFISFQRRFTGAARGIHV
ncbi:hypothetical protein CAPTEDRAFT_217359 [Capitella teleta]|uniref:Uncharacterized protein n=1 Tax=Capitella teleta TaxID=283909 RepID=R7VF85_CAPTE|nr:hypothetical protein CAPTEDRAFT_217359 [Capitella teleta]|eukprot:ELU17274.1 hypothetical protein CAPTEDRAFT_217359 [Capitella teleta]